MAMLQAHSNNSTTLHDRVLWFDGDSTINESTAVDTVLTNNININFFVDKLTKDIKRYNALVPKRNRLLIKTELRPLNFEWNIPQKYKDIDVISFISDKLTELYPSMDEDAVYTRQERCAEELALYKKYNLFDMIKTLIYIVDVLTTDKVVWGVGRGSSVASYILYLIGLHDVDSFQYNIDITEFLRD